MHYVFEQLLVHPKSSAKILGGICRFVNEIVDVEHGLPIIALASISLSCAFMFGPPSPPLQVEEDRRVS
jgi:hypothetical protein